MQQSLPNNIDIDNIEDNKKKVSKENSFDNLFHKYYSDPEIWKLLGEWLKARKAKRAALTDS